MGVRKIIKGEGVTEAKGKRAPQDGPQKSSLQSEVSPGLDSQTILKTVRLGGCWWYQSSFICVPDGDSHLVLHGFLLSKLFFI